MDGHVVVVTGASRGIGHATARLFAERGAQVALAARDAAALKQLEDQIAAAGGRCLSVPTDVGSLPSLDALVAEVGQRFGRVDVLVNNAGMLPPARRSELTPAADWQRTLDVNLTSAWYLSSRMKELMSSGSVVINVTSTAASYPSVGLASYCVSKVGLTMLTKVLALEWARDGIRVVAVAPGKVQTELAEPVLRYTDSRGLRVNPLGRVAETDELAKMIYFLASEDASFVTGSVIVCDGGELLQQAAQ